ncbi:reverse transcriptase domain-containing protein [Tanacetum coccineum]|uniref:Reverse transcriptase domain-containing protein n=1 Tax=Tanacetum coccineum TaxID=301880 RepID=A0ABQ4Y8F3_9ASTR
MSSTTIEQLIAQRMADAMTAYEANQNSGTRINNDRTSGSVTEEVVGLTRWFEKMEYVFHICNCTENYQVKYATCTLLDGALTWWNAYVQSVGLEATYETTWNELKNTMIEEYYPRNKAQKIEIELWNLAVKGTNIIGYTKRFQELALPCPSMVTPEYKKIE